jgi:hypothetical protein
VSPTAIQFTKANVAKDHPEEIKKIEVKVNGKAIFKLGDLKKDTKADPVVPDEKREQNSSGNKDVDPDSSKGIGFFGWFFIMTFLGVCIVGIWYFVRREQLKNEAREKMIHETPEMEGYD